MKIQLASDIHLEFEGCYERMPKIKAVSPDNVLVLAGDIGKPSQPIYKQFLNEMAQQFAKVIVVAGNHEYYKGEYYQAKQEMKAICDEHAEQKLVYGDKASYLHTCKNDQGEEEKVRFLCTTLWVRVL